MTITKTDLTEALNNFSKTTFEPALKRLEEKMATKDNLKDFATKDDMQEISKALLFITNNTYTKKEWDQKFSNIVRKVEIQIEHYRSEFRSAVDGYDHLNTKVKNHEKRITKLEERI